MVILWQNQGYWSVASHQNIQNIVGYIGWSFPYGNMENPNAAKRCPHWKLTKYIFNLFSHPLTPWYKDPKQVLSVKSSATYGIITIQKWMAIERRMTGCDSPVVRSRRCVQPKHVGRTTIGNPLFILHWNLRVKTSCRTPNEYSAYGIIQQQLLRLKVQA